MRGGKKGDERPMRRKGKKGRDSERGEIGKVRGEGVGVKGNLRCTVIV